MILFDELTEEPGKTLLGKALKLNYVLRFFTTAGAEIQATAEAELHLN